MSPEKKRRVVTSKTGKTKSVDPLNCFEPPEKIALIRVGINVQELASIFMALKIMPYESHIQHKLAAIRVSNLLDDLSQTKRKKLKTKKYRTMPELGPEKEIEKSFKTQTQITDKLLKEKLSALGFKKEAALKGNTIRKSLLVTAIKYFDGLLQNSKSNVYSTVTSRSVVICLWVNWFFKEKYNISATYKPEQIRKLISPTHF